MIQLQQYRPVIAYRPVACKATVVSTATILVETAKVDVKINGATVATFYKYYDTAVSSIFGFITWTFDIDVQRFCQDYFASNPKIKPSVIGNLGSGTLINNTDSYANVQITVTYYGRSAVAGSPPTYSATFSETSQIVEVFNQSYLHDEAMNWNSHGYLGNRFLTNRPRTITLCKEDNFFLSWTNDDTWEIDVSVFNAAGSLLSNGKIDGSTSSWVQLSHGFGIPNLQATTFATGSFTTAIGSIKQIVLTYNYGGGTTIEELYINFDECLCCDDKRVRLHWLNRLGGADSFSFVSKKRMNMEWKSEKAQTPLSWNLTTGPHTTTDEGMFVRNKEAIETIDIESQDLDDATAFWLNELLLSPRGYMEINNQYIPVIIRDGKFEYYNSDLPKQNLKITLEYANQRITHLQ